MKRSWIGGALLALLLAGSLLVSATMGRVHDPIAADLTAAGEEALTGNWPQAQTLFRQANSDWDRRERFRACFADHSPMEDIDSCFAQLEIYRRTGDATAFAALCADTARKITAMGQAHKLMLHNFF